MNLQKNTISDKPALVANEVDVRHVYRLLLGREPDTAGYHHMESLVKERSLSPVDLARLFMESPEFLAVHARSPIAKIKECNLEGYTMFVRVDDRDIGGAIAAGGNYEPHVAAVIHENLQTGDYFLDVGANVGFFTLFAASRVGPSGKVFAVEPMDKNLQLLYASTAKNKFTNIEVFPFAASSDKAILPIVTDAGTSNALVQTVASTKQIATYAAARTLDSMTSELGRLDLMKIDVEGHEVSALQGFTNGLARLQPQIVTEFHPKSLRENSGVDPNTYLKMLFEYGGGVLKVLTSPTKRIECRTPSEVMEQWESADIRMRTNGLMHLDLFVQPRC